MLLQYTLFALDDKSPRENLICIAKHEIVFKKFGQLRFNTCNVSKVGVGKEGRGLTRPWYVLLE